MASLSIGDFSRATHLGVKALRHYHQVGLLVPVEVDDTTGYRRYAAGQIGDALLIKRFRDLDLPLEHIRALLDAETVRERTELLDGHLRRLIGDLDRLQKATAGLAALLQPSTAEVSFRAAPAVHGAAITASVNTDSITPWLFGAAAELMAAVNRPQGPLTGLYDDEVFTEGKGQSTLYVATEVPAAPLGRVVPLHIPAAELCVITHHGAHATIDQQYATLGAHVARHEISTPGPIRETYLTGPGDTTDQNTWVTEIGWPIFHTRI